jgi:predicted DNA-binding protein with PD1-like motif
MEYKKFGEKVFVRIDRGEEIVESLIQVCKKLNITAGTVTGIGATDKVIIGIFDVETKEYHSSELIGNHEIVPIIGNISTMNGQVYLHLHINLSNSEHKSFGGHLNSAIVSATFEGVIDIIGYKIERELDVSTGLNILKFKDP